MVAKQKVDSGQARLEARISTDLHAILKRAAAIQGRTMTDFVVTAVESAAREAIENTEILRLSVEDQARFADALLNPPEPAPALKRALERHAKLIDGT